MIRILLPLTFLFLTSCMSTTVVLNKEWHAGSKPSYTDYFDSYWLGFSGRNTVNLAKVCMDQKPYAFRRQKTFEDGFITFVTLGIYTPTTFKVWCGD